ncbi:Guanine nucleotide exchange protein smcr8a [Nibea albiflora]|uniref:Guanine nucleotide exchange protein smcr8a n=1 Tax=Nibea albiflora TaxID=240163 RepID=A0ACB7FKU9_NIBAL|nr:Guanine nucleotide exchange protein smcr8a [Nibea albiflora]
MIGSPDLLAFTGTEGFGEGEEEQEGLPEEFSIPLTPPSHPWTSSAQFHRDFILVAEFSEQCKSSEIQLESREKQQNSLMFMFMK